MIHTDQLLIIQNRRKMEKQENYSSTHKDVLGKFTVKQSVEQVGEDWVHSIIVCLADNTPIANKFYTFQTPRDAQDSLDCTVGSDLEHIVRNALEDAHINIDEI